MDLVEMSEQRRMRREEAAERLREIADSLSRHNDFRFEREGIPFTVKVPDEVDVKVKVEIEDDETEIEIEISW